MPRSPLTTFCFCPYCRTALFVSLTKYLVPPGSGRLVILSLACGIATHATTVLLFHVRFAVATHAAVSSTWHSPSADSNYE